MLQTQHGAAQLRRRQSVRGGERAVREGVDETHHMPPRTVSATAIPVVPTARAIIPTACRLRAVFAKVLQRRMSGGGRLGKRGQAAAAHGEKLTRVVVARVDPESEAMKEAVNGWVLAANTSKACQCKNNSKVQST